MIKLKAYDLKCGHIQQEIIFDDHLFYTNIELYHEHCTYHVRSFKHVKNSSSTTRLSWECFDNLKDAQNFYRKLKKSIKVNVKQLKLI